MLGYVDDAELRGAIDTLLDLKVTSPAS
jgi:hypothetical protein